ncbi:MAG TPA: hypothetical protein VFO14_16145 [Vicinamibacterales bacterium]|nr:hypothetical protein [Vicinamibacterales bacterium]
MLKEVLMAVCAGAVVGGTAAAQNRKPAEPKPMVHEIIVTADTVYTGTVEMAVTRGKVTGDMVITSPTKITGKVAGSSKAGVLTLEFPFTMVEQDCEGTVKMTIKLGDKPGVGNGTMEAIGCGSEPDTPVTGTVELKPAAPKPDK